MKKIILTTVLVFSVAQLFAQEKSQLSQGNSATKSDTVTGRPADFPKFVDTGNPVADEENYRAAKQKYLEEHYGNEKKKAVADREKPTERVNPSGQKSKNLDDKGRLIIPKEDFDQYPQEKKDRILSQPEKFVIQ